jgi:ribosomal protein L9
MAEEEMSEPIPIPANELDKRISDPTAEEQQKIYSDIQKGIKYKNYDIKTFANGNFRVVKKKAPTTREKVVKQISNTKQSTDVENLLLREHITEMKVEIEKLKMKNKKRKKEHQDLFYYAEDEEVAEKAAENPENLENVDPNKTVPPPPRSFRDRLRRLH